MRKSMNGVPLDTLPPCADADVAGRSYSREVSASIGERGRHGVEVRVPDLLGERWQDVVPDRREAADQLREPGRPRHEPPVQVLAAVAPAADVDAADLADRADGALDPREQDAQLGREL